MGTPEGKIPHFSVLWKVGKNQTMKSAKLRMDKLQLRRHMRSAENKQTNKQQKRRETWVGDVIRKSY